VKQTATASASACPAFNQIENLRARFMADLRAFAGSVARFVWPTLATTRRRVMLGNNESRAPIIISTPTQIQLPADSDTPSR